MMSFYHDESYTAFVYEEDGITAHDFTVFKSKEEAINFAKPCNWDEVVDDNSGEIVWQKDWIKAE